MCCNTRGGGRLSKEIATFLQILHRAQSGVVEVCLFNESAKPTHVGYFDNLDAAAKVIATNDGKGNIFVTLNPASRDLLARANNRLIEGSYKKPVTRTLDSEIVCDSWLFVDIDPKRPRGISSTDTELAAAREVGKAVRDWLIEIGVPPSALLTAQSGNGLYILVRLPDYPITEKSTAIKKAFINHVADLFDTAHIEIDRSVFNPARLLCALGTMKVKGENIAERPHRRSCVRTVAGERFDPERDQHCEPFDLYALAERILPPVETQTPQSNVSAFAHAFDIRNFADRLQDQKTTQRDFTYYTCPGCGGFQKLYVNEHTGAYGCFHFGKGTCSVDAIRDALGKPKAQPQARLVAASGNTNLRSSTALAQRYQPELAPEPEAPEPWESPAPFYEFDLPSFPTDTLPPWLKAHVEGVATATQTPTDMCALLDLAAVAAGVARNVRVCIREGWIEPLNLYVLAAQPPGSKKSSVTVYARQPLEQYERELIEAGRDEIAEAVNEYRVLEARWEKAVKDCAKLDGTDLDARKSEAKELKQQLDGLKVPALPQLIADDITSEELATKLAEQGGRMAIFSAEGGIFDVMAGRYSSGGVNIDVYLKSHPGDLLRINRRNRAEYVEAPALTLGLAVQPDVIQGLAGKPGFRGRGLVGRFLYTMPPSSVGKRKIRPAPLRDEAKNTYARNVQELARIQPYGTDADQARLLRFTKDADDYLAAFEERLEPQLCEGGDLHTLADWGAKLAGAVARIAGLLHLVENVGRVNSGTWPGDIPAETVKQAITIGEYLIPHARAAYAEMGADPKIEDAKFIVRWLERDGRAVVSKRDIHQANKGRFKEVAALDPALQVLQDHDYLRLIEPERKSDGVRKKGQKFAVNPFLTSRLNNLNNLNNTSSKRDIAGNPAHT
jgi:replicative DNA helicase